MKLSNYIRVIRSLLLIHLLIFINFCSRTPIVSIYSDEPDIAIKKGFYQRGIASWYGKKFHNRRTANTEIYNMYRLTAAHKSLPFNTLVEVLNLSNNRSVIVRINDRGPFVKNRIIDLSLKAAQKIDMAETGTAEVKIFILSRLKAKTQQIEYKKDPLASFNNTYFIIQAGAFNVQDNALKTLQSLKSIMPEDLFTIKHIDGFFKVVSKEKYLNQKADEIITIMKQNNLNAYKKRIFNF
jgi:rare lipoprotein A